MMILWKFQFQKSVMQVSRWFSDLDWRFLLLILPPISLLLMVSLSFYSSPSSSSAAVNLFSPFKSIFNHPEPARDPKKLELEQSRMAVCLVGGARRFELTGPSIVQKILKVYPNTDLFLHSPLDSSAYKFSLLKTAPRIASVKIFRPSPIPENESEARVLTARDSPNGIQGLLQYFNLVEGCLTMIQAYQAKNNFTYDWIVRTRVDGYWSAPLSPDLFVPGQYIVPPGSSYGGLNDRLGIGNMATSVVALSRLSLIPQLDSAGYQNLNSETSFKAQLTIRNVTYVTKPMPFCIVSDRKYSYPPSSYGVPVAAVSSRGRLSGAKCRPCTPVCTGTCVMGVMDRLFQWWSWFPSPNGTLQLCDARGEWEMGWEKIFDQTAGKKLAAARRRVKELTFKQCVNSFEEMRRRSAFWDAPAAAEICKLGLKFR